MSQGEFDFDKYPNKAGHRGVRTSIKSAEDIKKNQHLLPGLLKSNTLGYDGKGQLNIYSDPTFQFIFREWFTNPDYAWPFIVAMGFVASFSFYCVFSAYSVASPPVVSLYEYSLIIWAILIGYFLFNDIPTPRTFLGVFLIIGAGIYIYMREKARDQMIVSDTPNR